LNKVLKSVYLLVLSLCLMGANTDTLKLPNLGDASTSLFSAEKEYQIGRTWLRIFRSRVPTSGDPQIADYLEDLIYRLATHSQLEDRRLDVVIVNNKTLNAFAVPGGVVGIHDGLLAYAQSEDELATVLAHELAHLSQRHFSRGVEEQKRQTPLALAGLLAGLVLIATTGSDAGMAAISASQAVSMQSQLKFSRGNEQEADRIGMLTLIAADMNPYAAPAMFERMLKATRYSGRNVPDFLLTHPVTESRIADTRNRARRYKKTITPENTEYHLMRARVRLSQEISPQLAAQRFRIALEGDPISPDAERYGLALALTETGQLQQARRELTPLLLKYPDQIAYIIADANIDIASNKSQNAANKLSNKLALTPGNYPLSMSYAEALLKSQQPHIAEEVLVALSKTKPLKPIVWYQLAETQGLAGNILGLHRSRAEYFLLKGNLDRAIQQLKYALNLTSGSFSETAKIRQRLVDIEDIKEMMKNL